MSQTIIKVEGLSKQYRLGKIGTGSFAHDMNRWFHKIRGKEDPYIKIGEVNDRSQKGNSDYVWSLRDINFEVKQGDSVGIIGRNGAGKSTLLKILSRTTSPTTGQIKLRGKVASLLEVGTGFHPELTGRENIYLNGAILGMTKKEINKKFDEIVDFSGVERYIDTPVKRYSSGMYVRLAFVVAAHLEPDILIVDEVLAVGDAEFQRKALGKMKDVSQRDGRTVLFVSHNLASLQNLCSTGILLQNGNLVLHGNINDAIDEYIKSGKVASAGIDLSAYHKSDRFKVESIQLIAENGEDKDNFYIDEFSEIRFRVRATEVIKNFSCSVRINTETSTSIVAWRTKETINASLMLERGESEIKLKIFGLNLVEGNYNISVSFNEGTESLFFADELMSFKLFTRQVNGMEKAVERNRNIIYTPCSWNINSKEY